MGFLGIFWKWFFYHTEVLHLFSRQTEDIMQILNVWNIERKCWQETNSKMNANLWLTFSKNVEQTFLESLILPFVKICSHSNFTKKKIYEKIGPIIWTFKIRSNFSKQKIIPEYLGHKKQAVYDFRNFTEIIMLG